MTYRVLSALLACIIVQVHACGIVCYIGNDLCRAFVLNGLSRLEYRGYDSAGQALLDAQSGNLVCIKSAGPIENLKKKLDATSYDGYSAISHTRWATHGPATDSNAHPHLDCNGKTAIVHNGIIENYLEIKESLQASGHIFTSDTDSEVIAHFFRAQLNQGLSLQDAALHTLSELKGSCATVILMQDHPDTLVALRKGAPLCIGMADQEKYIASDFLAFAGKSSDIVFIPDNSFAVVTRDKVNLYNAQGQPLAYTISTIKVEPSSYQKLGHEHYMLKEIYEQPRVIKQAVQQYRSMRDKFCEQLGLHCATIANLESINFFACGTSWHAALIGKFFFEQICGVPVKVHIASEYRYERFLPEKNSLYIALSQSGETADTLECIRMIKEHGLPVAVMTNVATSTMVREADWHMLLHAGPEIAVASTKAFTAQLTALYWLAHYCAWAKGLVSLNDVVQAEDDLVAVADVMFDALESYRVPIIQELAPRYARMQNCMFLGRHSSYPFALEAALKLKEISYIFAQGFAAGELKHGSIALIDANMPVIIFSHLDPVLYKKIVSNAQEVKARKGHIVAFVFHGQDELAKLADVVFEIPQVPSLLAPLAMVGVMQFFVYQIAKELGRDIDKPRNLAKAVTVE